ncbi:hypothetical protein CD58_00465 [Pseudomonas brassicacearum]|nr:hypothetical protein CD58_00465 [Pseudomonas brassicacearum]
MSKQMLAQDLLELLEPLAAIEHERWSHWQKYLHSQCSKNRDGSLTIPCELVERWEQQLKTPYHNLSQKEKDSDREQVKRYLDFILQQIDI